MERPLIRRLMLDQEALVLQLFGEDKNGFGVFYLHPVNRKLTKWVPDIGWEMSFFESVVEHRTAGL